MTSMRRVETAYQIEADAHTHRVEEIGKQVNVLSDAIRVSEVIVRSKKRR